MIEDWELTRVWAVRFESDDAPYYMGPFATEALAFRYLGRLTAEQDDPAWLRASVVVLFSPAADNMTANP
jgi:hypothetical protein